MPADIAPTGLPGEWPSLLRWNDQELIPVIAQQHDTGEVLMFAWANREAVQKTLSVGLATYFSRSRGGLWTKGETSGYAQRVIEIRIDCDGDCLLYRVDAPGPACHQLRRSCFSTRLDADGSAHTDRPVIVASP
jgi:phosphoribosyl-AMP cyclohydrolase